MTAWIGVAIFFGLILIVGLVAALVLERHHPGWRRWEAGAYVWGLGTGLVTWLLFLPSTIGWPVPLTGIVWLALPAGILAIGMARTRRSVSEVPRRSGSPPLRTLDVALIAIIVILLLSSATSAVSLPLQRFDAITHFGLKAKVLLEEQNFRAEAFTDPLRVHFHRTYPPLVPLLEASVSTRIGWHDEHKIKIIFPAFYAALLCLIYGAQRSFASRTHSLLFTALLASAPLVSSDSAGGAASGLADLPFAFFATASALATSRGIASGRAMDGILGGLMAGFAICTKQEGSILIAVIGVSLGVHLGLSARRGEWAKALPCVMAWACAVMVIALPWWVVRAGPSRSDVGGIGWYLSQLHPERLTLLPSRILPLARLTLEEFFQVGKWLLLWPLVLAGVLSLASRKGRISGGPEASGSGVVIGFLVPLWAILLSLYLGVMLVTPLSMPWQVGYSLSRVILHLLPLGVFLASWSCRQVADVSDLFRERDLRPADE